MLKGFPSDKGVLSTNKLRRTIFFRFEEIPKGLSFPLDNQTEYTLRKRLPDALVIGVMKCGTDALRAFLSLHPYIAMSHNEPNYWCEHFHKGYEYYIDQMAMSRLGQISMEKSTCFTHERLSSPKRVYLYNR